MSALNKLIKKYDSLLLCSFVCGLFVMIPAVIFTMAKDVYRYDRVLKGEVILKNNTCYDIRANPSYYCEIICHLCTNENFELNQRVEFYLNYDFCPHKTDICSLENTVKSNSEIRKIGKYLFIVSGSLLLIGFVWCGNCCEKKDVKQVNKGSEKRINKTQNHIISIPSVESENNRNIRLKKASEIIHRFFCRRGVYERLKSKSTTPENSSVEVSISSSWSDTSDE